MGGHNYKTQINGILIFNNPFVYLQDKDTALIIFILEFSMHHNYNFTAMNYRDCKISVAYNVNLYNCFHIYALVLVNQFLRCFQLPFHNVFST